MLKRSREGKKRRGGSLGGGTKTRAEQNPPPAAASHAGGIEMRGPADSTFHGGGGWKEGRWGPNHNQVERGREGRKEGGEWMARHQRTPPRKRYAAAPLHLRRTVPHLTLSPRDGVPDAWPHRTEGLQPGKKCRAVQGLQLSGRRVTPHGRRPDAKIFCGRPSLAWRVGHRNGSRK